MKTTSRIISALLTLVMLLSIVSAGIVSTGAASPSATLTVENVSAVPGSTVEVDVEIKNNPGIIGASLKLSYGEGLTLTDAAAGDAWSSLSMTKPGKFQSPCTFTWDALEIQPNQIKDGVILKLTFAVAEDATSDTALPVNIDYEYGDVADNDMNFVSLDITNGHVTVIDYTPGDVDNNGKVNSLDVIYLRRYIAGGYDVVINTLAANVNGDTKINTLDTIMIRRFIAGGYTDSNGDPLVLLPFPIDHTHKLVHVARKEATNTEEGMKEHWYCSGCGKYFSDSAGKTEVNRADLIISIPDPDPDGIPITYHLYDGDNYLADIGVNNPNPEYYVSSKGLKLQNLKADGYIFDGWYDSEGNNGELIKNIPSGSTDEYELYARWRAREYTISFQSPLVPVSSQKYFVNTGATLANLELNGYNFTGWCDDKDNLVTSIPKGTTGNMTLYANWTSKRNQTRPVSKLDEPIILEDSENGTILFSYEIGTIENVPLQQISDVYQSVGGMKQTYTTYSSATIGDTEAKTVAKTVSNTTSDSKSWSLSSDWNDVTSVSESYASQKGWTKEEAETRSKTSSNTYSINSSSGGSKSFTSSSGLSGTLSSSNSSTSGSSVGATRETGSEFGVNGKMSVGGEVGASVGIDEVASVGAKVSGGYEIGASYSNYGKNGASINLNHSNTGTNASTISANKSDASSSSSTWNTSSGYSRSSSTSQSNTVATVLSEVISESKGYGQSYARGGSENNTQAFTKSTSESDQYSSAITYSNTTTDSYTKTIELGGNSEGYYRFVLAGTAHVFAVVGYDVSTSSYYEFTYTVMDDKTYTFVDYSKTTASFNDNENGVLPFEVPFFVKEYVDARMLKSEGLSISQEGIVTGYSGEADVVFVPSYYKMDNMDGETYTSIKVQGIAPNAFAGKNITAISLSNFIEEIPDNAFRNCSSLEAILCPGVKSIGNEAFYGCSSINEFSIPWGIESLGNNVFKGVNKISVQASTKDVAYGTLNSGAKQVILNISANPNEMEGAEFIVPTSVDYFELRGNANTYSNTKLVSEANTTVINGLNIICNSGIPLKISSEHIVFNRLNVNSNGFSALLSNPKASISLYGSIRLSSESGKAVVCKNIDLSHVDESISSSLRVTGNIYVCGEIEGQSNLQVEKGEIIYIDEDEFNKYIRGSYDILFDANGGTIDITSKTVYYGLKIGDLPIPSRDYYQFKGWYTDPGDSGEMISSDTVYEKNENINVYAHWVENDTSDWVLKSEVPENAKIVDEKWTYLQKETTSSGSSSMDGWIGYDKQRTGWGPTQGPVYSDPSNGERNVWSESYVTSSNYKTVYHYFRYSTKRVADGKGGSDISGTSYGSNYYTYDFDYELTNKGAMGNHSQGYKYYYNASNGNTASGNYITVWKCDPFTTREKISDNYGTRWYYQEPVNTYHYYRYVDKESSEQVEPSETISGVQHWVKYITKTSDDFVKTDFDAVILNMDSQKPIENNQGNVVVGTENHTESQVWHFTRCDDGTYQIISYADDKVIDLSGSGIENGTNIGMYEAHGKNNQHWYLQVYDGGYNLIPKCSPNGAMDLTGGKTEDNTNVQFYQWNGSSAQIFEIKIISDLESYLS